MDIRRIKWDILVDDDPEAIAYARLIGRKGTHIPKGNESGQEGNGKIVCDICFRLFSIVCSALKN
jgi:hypothetical protein